MPGDLRPTSGVVGTQQPHIRGIHLVAQDVQLFDRPGQVVQRLTGGVGGHDRVHGGVQRRDQTRQRHRRAGLVLVLVLVMIPLPLYFEH